MQQTERWCVMCIQNLKPSDGAARFNNCSDEPHYFCGDCLKKMPARFRCPLKNCLALIDKSKMSALTVLPAPAATENLPPTACNHDLVGAFAKVCFNAQCDKENLVFCNSCPKELQHSDCTWMFAFEFPKRCKVEVTNLAPLLTQTLARLASLRISIDGRLKLAELIASEGRLMQNLNVASFVANRRQFTIETSEAQIVLKSQALERLNFLLISLNQLQPVADLSAQIQNRFDEWASWNDCKSFPVKVVQNAGTSLADQDESRLNLNIDATENTEGNDPPMNMNAEREFMMPNPLPQQVPNHQFQQVPIQQFQPQLQQANNRNNPIPESTAPSHCFYTVLCLCILSLVFIIILLKCLFLMNFLVESSTKQARRQNKISRIESHRQNVKLLLNSPFAQSKLLNGYQATLLTNMFKIRNVNGNTITLTFRYNSKYTRVSSESFQNQFQITNAFLLIIKSNHTVGGIYINSQNNQCYSSPAEIQAFSLNQKVKYSYSNFNLAVKTFPEENGKISS